MRKNHILSASFSALAAFAIMSAAAQTVTTPDIKDSATLSGTTGTLEDTTATEEKAF